MSCIVQHCHTYGECDVMQSVGVMFSIQLLWWHREFLWCHLYIVYLDLQTGCGFIYRGSDVISRVVWWHKDWMWCYIYCAYDVTQKLGVISFKSGCDISGEVMMTKIHWVRCLILGVWCHAWRGCDIIKTVVWCDRVDVMSSAVQRMSYICRVWCHQHRILWFHT